MMIGLLRPSETDCWWGTKESTIDERGPCLPGAAAGVGGAGRETAVGRCASDTIIGMVWTEAGLAPGWVWEMLGREGRGAGGDFRLAL